MSRNRTIGTFAAAALAISLFGACSAESLTERAVEFGLEQAAESNGETADLDLDFNNDGDGGFSISTEEGDFAFNLDGENGGIVFDTDEGDGVINFDEDGITFDTDEGTGGVYASSEVPDNWPASLGIPASANPEATFFSVFAMPDGGSTTAVFEHAANDSYPSDAQAALVALGWTQLVTSDDGEILYSQFSNGDSAAIVTSDGTTTTVTLTVRS